MPGDDGLGLVDLRAGVVDMLPGLGYAVLQRPDVGQGGCVPGRLLLGSGPEAPLVEVVCCVCQGVELGRGGGEKVPGVMIRVDHRPAQDALQQLRVGVLVRPAAYDQLAHVGNGIRVRPGGSWTCRPEASASPGPCWAGTWR